MGRGGFCAVILLAMLAGAARGDDFPPGTQHDLVAHACTQCHDAAQVTSQHLSTSQWESVVRTMIGDGAKLAEADINDVVAYLARNFG